VRGIISKLRARFTLSVEIYETENGTLVALSDPIRSESVDELVEKAAEACSNMYKTFVTAQNAMKKPQPAADTAAQQPEKKAKPKKEKPAPRPKPEPRPRPKREPISINRPPMKLSAGGGAFFANDFGGGLDWGDGVQVTMPYSGGGAYLFFDAVYAEAFFGISGGGGKWESGNVSATDTTVLPDMSRLYFNIGVFAKYPVAVGNIKLFPLAGIDYEASISGKLVTNEEYPFDGKDGRYDANALSAVWFKFGGGMDAALGQKLYIRAELLYGLRGTNKFEETEAKNAGKNAKTKGAGGITARVGAGIDI